MFMSMLKICGLIRQKLIEDNFIITIQKDQWISFKLKYEMTNIEFNTSTLFKPLGSMFRKDVTFIHIGKMIYHSF